MNRVRFTASRDRSTCPHPSRLNPTRLLAPAPVSSNIPEPRPRWKVAMCLARLSMAPVSRTSCIILYLHFSFRTTHYPPHLPLMSRIHPSSTSSNFRLIFENALKVYKIRTDKDLLTHPLSDRLEACDSASSILTVLQGQFQELGFNESQRSTMEWLDPTVDVLLAFSGTLGEGVGSVCLQNMNWFEIYPLIFVCLIVILTCKSYLHRIWCSSFCVYFSECLRAVHRNTKQTAKDFHADQDALFHMLERMRAFFQRLHIFATVVPSRAMEDTITAIMVEVLNLIGIATKAIKQRRTSKCFLYK
jgi:hypothetical protein